MNATKCLQSSIMFKIKICDRRQNLEQENCYLLGVIRMKRLVKHQLLMKRIGKMCHKEISLNTCNCLEVIPEIFFANFSRKSKFSSPTSSPCNPSTFLVFLYLSLHSSRKPDRLVLKASEQPSADVSCSLSLFTVSSICEGDKLAFSPAGHVACTRHYSTTCIEQLCKNL